MNKEEFKNFRGPKGFKRFKKGWTLVELCVAMIALAILVGISVQSIKPRRLLIAPFAYAAIQNLKQANNYILAKCDRAEVFGCRPSDSRLPDSELAYDDMLNYYNNLTDQQKQDEGLTTKPTTANMDDVYCLEVANLFTLVNETINCKYKSGTGDGTELPSASNGNKGTPNFQASNMVAYYYLERPWYSISRAMPTENDEEAMKGVMDTFAKQIWIDVNGDEKPNKIGEDQFALRIYITGEIIPSGCKFYEDEEQLADTRAMDINHFYCPSGATGEEDWLKTSYPFSYNLFRSYVPDMSDTDKRKTETELRGVSYQEAACKSGRDILIPRRSFCAQTEIPNGESYDTLENCKTGENSAFCVTRLARPGNPGLFRLPVAL